MALLEPLQCQPIVQSCIRNQPMAKCIWEPNTEKRLAERVEKPHLNLLTITAIIRSTKTVMIATVIIRLVAILEEGWSASHIRQLWVELWMIYLRDIPLNVLTLLSTNPSLCIKVSCVCWMVSLCLCRSASVLAPIASVSFANAWLAFNLCELRSNLSVPDRSCCLCSSWTSFGLSE